MLYLCRNCKLEDCCRENMVMCLNGAGYSPKDEAATNAAPVTPLDVQVGGDHYKTMPIQPIEFCHKNGLGPCETLAIKYLCRYKNKNGAQDIDKAIHVLQLLKELEYGGNPA